jgi:hypothetical protein
VGQGAQDLARQTDITTEANLKTDRSRQRFLKWRRRIDPVHYPDPNRQASLAPEELRRFTGRGAANLYNPAAFLCVEELRRGATPLDTGMAVRAISRSATRMAGTNWQIIVIGSPS